MPRSGGSILHAIWQDQIHRQRLDEQIHTVHTGERSFRDVSEEMWGSLNVPFDESMKAMKEHLVIDPDFADFHDFCIREGVAFNVISAGLEPVLRGVLNEFLGHHVSERIDIISNAAEISADGSEWKPIWRHDSQLGHDKSLSVKECRAHLRKQLPGNRNPLIIFVGDGVSDLPAAREADVLFARGPQTRGVLRILDSGDLERYKKPHNRTPQPSSLGKQKFFGSAVVDTRKTRRTEKGHMSPISAHFNKGITIAQ
ncbi:HAD-like domain-containing protein [Lipomyces starkeyi]